jgi:hypothetical protein
MVLVTIGYKTKVYLYLLFTLTKITNIKVIINKHRKEEAGGNGKGRASSTFQLNSNLK